MKISPEEKKKFDQILTNLNHQSQRALVSLRGEEWDKLSVDFIGLGETISQLVTESDHEMIPTVVLAGLSDFDFEQDRKAS